MLLFQETKRLLEKKKRQRKKSCWLSHSLQVGSHRRVPRRRSLVFLTAVMLLPWISLKPPGRRGSLLSPITALQKLLLQLPTRR